VRSVLDQTFQDLEMVVVDDGSSDGSWGVLKALEKEDGRLRVLRHESGANQGVNETLRLAVDHSEGRYLARIDQDDRWAPDKLEHQVPALDEGAHFCYGRARRIDFDGNALPIEKGGGRIGARWDGFPGSEAATPFEALLMRNYVPLCTAVISKEAYYRVGGYSPCKDFRHRHDFALWTRLVTLAEPAFIDRILADYRVHSAQMSGTLREMGTDFHEDLSVVEDLRRWPGLPQQLLPVTDSWLRCQRTLASLADGDDIHSSGAILEAEDAEWLARILPNRLGRMSELIGLRRLHHWTVGVRRLDPAFHEAIGRVWKVHLYRSFRDAYRNRRVAKAAKYATALLAAKVAEYRWLPVHILVPISTAGEEFVLPAFATW
jgi:glycosyltransferase involved in cell wall biosynthesis